MGVNKKVLVILTIGLIFSLYFVSWIYFDNHTPGNDEVLHYGYLLDQEKNIEMYPPFYYKFTQLFFQNNDLKTALIPNLIFYILFIIYFPKLTKIFLGKKYITLTLLMALSNYFIDYFSKRYLLDFPVLVLTVMFVYHLKKSKSFTDLDNVLVLTIITAIGLNLKWTFPFYIIVPVIYEIRVIRKLSKKQIINSLFFILPVVLSLFVWYYKNDLSFLTGRIYLSSILKSTIPYPNIMSIESIFFYFFSLIVLNNFLFTPLFFYGAYSLIKKRDYYLLLWLIIPYILFTVSIEKQARHMLSLVPVVILITMFGYKKLQIRFEGIKYVIIILLIFQVIFTIVKNPIEDDPFMIDKNIESIPNKENMALGVLAWDDLTQGIKTNYKSIFKKSFQIPEYKTPSVLNQKLAQLELKSYTQKISLNEKFSFYSQFILNTHKNPTAIKENNWLNFNNCIIDGQTAIKNSDYILSKPFNGDFYNKFHPDYVLGKINKQHTYYDENFKACQDYLYSYIIEENDFEIYTNVTVRGFNYILFERKQ